MIDFLNFVRRGVAAQDAVDRLVQIINPTGGEHTPTPWKTGDDSIGMRPETALDLTDGFQIRTTGGTHGDALIAVFKHKPDRDLALYFTNVHAGMIAVIRDAANFLDFLIETGAWTDPPIVREKAEQLRTYADLFCRLGKPEP